MRKKGTILLCILLMLSLYACRTNDSANINEVATDIILEETEVMNSFVSWCPYPDDYLKELCDTYELEKLTENCKSDYDNYNCYNRYRLVCYTGLFSWVEL